MSVVVRMEMPQGCEDCPFRDALFCCCAKGRKYAGSSPVRPNWCPIICQLPEGHGRLGDLDELCDGLVSNHPVVIHAKNAPTIVPADTAERSET